MLDVGGGVLHEPLALAQIGAQSGELAAGPEAGSQEPVLVQAPEPLGVAHIRLPAGDALGVPGVDEHDLEAALLEDFEGGEPIDARGLHRDGPHPAALEPVREAVQVAREGAEGAHRLGVAVRRDRRHVHRRADVDRRRIRVDGRQAPPGPALRSGHVIASILIG